MKEISVIELQQSYFNPTKRETKKKIPVIPFTKSRSVKRIKTVQWEVVDTSS